MFDEIERLDLEFLNIQIIDGYYKDGKLFLDSCFFRKDYKDEIEQFQSLLESFSNEDDDFLNDLVDYEFSFDDIMEVLVADLDIYSAIYRVPEIKITNAEWDLLFTKLGCYYLDHGLGDFFLCDMVSLNKYALAKAMVYEERKVDLETYLSSLKYIESNILSLANIVEISEELSDSFEVDVLSLIADERGEFISNIVKKDSVEFLINDIDLDEDIDVVTKKMKDKLEQKGFSVVDCIEEVKPKKSNDKIINFLEYKARNRK